LDYPELAAARPAFGAMLLRDVPRYLAPQLAFLSKAGAASLIGCLSGHPVALVGFVQIEIMKRHGVSLRHR
jgi:hypothetical protein